MSKIFILFSVLCAGTSAFAADANHPTVVELYQSQGCSSCPPANAVLNSIADRPNLIALSFAVTYWDRLGWKDVFAKPEFTNRQSEYADYQNKSNVFTPQMVINGRGVLVGSNPADVEVALKKYDRGNNGPEISVAGDKISISNLASAQNATVWLAQYDPRVINVPVKAGENNGRTLPHKNVVRTLTALGKWTGAPLILKGSTSASGLKSVLLLQSGSGGPIIAARRLK
jgi:hypothetical protein